MVGPPTRKYGGRPASGIASQAYGVGDYDIAVGGASAANYDFEYSPGTLSITKAHLTVTAGNVDVGHGDPLPPLTYSITGFAYGQDASSIGGAPALATSATSTSPAGRYAITVAPGSLTAANYDFTFVPGTVTVHPRVTDVRVEWGSQSMSILGLRRDLPFVNIRAIDVIFSDDVSVDAADLALASSLVAGRSYTPSAFSYDPATHSARWTLASPLGVDKLTITLDGDPAGHDGVHAPGGIYLGAYSAGFAVLPGDLNGDGKVDANDLSKMLAGTLGVLDKAIDVWAYDIDGDGKIGPSDYTAVKGNVGKKF